MASKVLHAEWTLFHMLMNAVERTPDKTAIVCSGREYTYADLLMQSSRLARALKAGGLRRGDRVGIYLEKSWEAVLSMIAIGHAGGVYVNINPQLKSAQVTHVLRFSGGWETSDTDWEKLAKGIEKVFAEVHGGK